MTSFLTTSDAAKVDATQQPTSSSAADKLVPKGTVAVVSSKSSVVMSFLIAHLARHFTVSTTSSELAILSLCEDMKEPEYKKICGTAVTAALEMDIEATAANDVNTCDLVQKSVEGNRWTSISSEHLRAHWRTGLKETIEMRHDGDTRSFFDSSLRSCISFGGWTDS